MPFIARSLSLSDSIHNGSAAQGRDAMTCFWRYATPDALAAVVTAGYFNDARGQLRAGDVIEVAAGIGGTPATDTYTFSAVPASGNVTLQVEAGTA
jgi:hypothetical protein